MTDSGIGSPAGGSKEANSSRSNQNSPKIGHSEQISGHNSGTEQISGHNSGTEDVPTLKQANSQGGGTPKSPLSPQTSGQHSGTENAPTLKQANSQGATPKSPFSGLPSSRNSEDEDALFPQKRATLDAENVRSSDSWVQNSHPLNEENQTEVRPSSRSRRLQYFRSGADSDCEVHVLSNFIDSDEIVGSICYKKFACHRLFLATASEKLDQDVYCNSQWNGVLQINGVSPESVEVFLEFIYTFEVNDTMVNLGTVGDIYILSCAYNIPELLRAYSKKLMNIEWPLESIFPVFDLAFRHNIPELERVCMEKIIERADDLAQDPGLMKLQVYALNYVIQHWMVAEAMPIKEVISLLQQYQEVNDLTFSNTQKFPHFTKIIKYFPNVLLDAEGLIRKLKD